MKISNKKRLLSAISAVLLVPVLFACTPSGVEESSESGDESEGSNPKWETKTTISFDGKSYEVTGVNTAPDGEGIYYFDREGGLVSAPEQSGEFTDCAVTCGIVAAIYENEPAIIPESGFVVRFYGVKPEREPELGAQANCSFKSHAYIPERYVKIGDVVTEVGYRNIVRLAEETGYLFDEGWYASTTRSNVYGTEIAVDANGVVVEVNPSGTSESGDTALPVGGYVLSVGQNSALESRLKNVAVGDKAEYVETKNLYTVKKFIVNEKNITGQRPDNSIIYYSNPEKENTPVGGGTDIIVDANGIVTKVLYNTQGWNYIPAGGFAISGTGNYTRELANSAHVGDLCVLFGVRNLYFISNPQTLYDSYVSRLDEIKDDYRKAVADLRYVDYQTIDEDIAKAERLLKPNGDETPKGVSLVNAVETAREYIERCETELIPSVTVGDRTAWVTVGETDYNHQPYLHYYDDESVERTVAYAKYLNLNTLIIDNLASGYVVYHSDVPGLVEHPALGDFDVIKSFCEACEKYDIRLIVMPGALLGVESAINFPENHFTKLYADYLIKSKNGSTVDAYGIMSVDPSEPVIRQLVFDMSKELAEKYPTIYGIQFDYIRYPLPNAYQLENYDDFGYDSPASEQFKKKYKVDPKTMKIDNELWDKWCEARRDVITSLVRELYTELKKIKPELNISFTCFADYGDRQKYVYQEPEKWADEGIADAIYPMIYGDNTAYQLRYAEEIAPASENASIVLGVGTYVGATYRSMAEQLYQPFELGYEGTSIFTLRYISTCSYGDLVVKAFRNPATPTGEKGKTALATVKMLVDRTEKLKYIYPKEAGLAEYHKKLSDRYEALMSISSIYSIFASLPEPDYASELLASVDITDDFLLQTLTREAAYAEKLISRSSWVE